MSSYPDPTPDEVGQAKMELIKGFIDDGSFQDSLRNTANDQNVVGFSSDTSSDAEVSYSVKSSEKSSNSSDSAM
jgi:hypothetical protein